MKLEEFGDAILMYVRSLTGNLPGQPSSHADSVFARGAKLTFATAAIFTMAVWITNYATSVGSALVGLGTFLAAVIVWLLLFSIAAKLTGVTIDTNEAFFAAVGIFSPLIPIATLLMFQFSEKSWAGLVAVLLLTVVPFLNTVRTYGRDSERLGGRVAIPALVASLAWLLVYGGATKVTGDPFKPVKISFGLSGGE